MANPAAMFVIVGTTNSANLLDGLDGLLGSVALVDMATLGLLARHATTGKFAGHLLLVATVLEAIFHILQDLLVGHALPVHRQRGKP